MEQAARHCRLAYPDRTVDIEMGNNKASGIADITIASIKSLVSKDRMEKFLPDRFKLVLVDEAHHIVAPSYREVLGHFGLNEFSENSPALVGVSATFSRFDGLKLGAAIDHIVYHKDYVDMIDEKWLANAVFTTVKSEADLSRVKKDKSGDFSTASLSRAVNTEKTNSITVRAWLANAAGRKSTLVFCVDVEHARQLTAMFREYGVDARYITSMTTREVRTEQLRAFKDQEYPVLLNCGLFTEGTDIPNIDCVLLARPTRSKNLLIQMIGRGLRLFPGKKDCHIIDMVATLETGVLSTPTLFGLHPDEVLDNSTVDSVRERKEREEVTGEETPLLDSGDITTDSQPPTATGDENVNLTFTKYDSIFDLLQDTRPERYIRSLSPNAWIKLSEDRYILSEINGWLTIEKDDNKDNKDNNGDMYSVKHVMKVNLSPDPTDTTKPTSFYTRPRTVATAPDLETTIRAADTYAKEKFESRYIATRQPWRRNPATPSQLAMLDRANVRDRGKNSPAGSGAGGLTRGQAADMITKLKFGGKKRYAELEAKKRAVERVAAKKREFEGLVRRSDVRVGPVES